MDDETRRYLISQKVSFVNSIVHIGMQWWVSSIVFSGTVLAAVWTIRKELAQSRAFVFGLGISLGVFFFVIAFFGFMVSYWLGRVQDETARLAAQLGYPREKFFQTEIETFQKSMRLGAGSFALMHVVWMEFWLHLRGETDSNLYAACGVAGCAFWFAIWFAYYWSERRHHRKKGRRLRFLLFTLRRRTRRPRNRPGAAPPPPGRPPGEAAP